MSFLSAVEVDAFDLAGTLFDILLTALIFLTADLIGFGGIFDTALFLGGSVFALTELDVLIVDT